MLRSFLGSRKISMLIVRMGGWQVLIRFVESASRLPGLWVSVENVREGSFG